MGGWYVELLLKNSDRIRSAINDNIIVFINNGCDEDSPESSELYEVDGDARIGDIGVETDLDDFDYNNLLLVENKLKELKENGQISNREWKIVLSIQSGKSLSRLEKETNMSRVTIAKIFSEVCNRISFLLGNIFTDDGFLEYIKLKYNLTEEQLDKAREYMSSNKRHSG